MVGGGKRFTRVVEDFTCEFCGNRVKGRGYTDHCPKCLRSKHVDIMPGDRKSPCGGMMVPVGATHDRKSFVLEYECEKCGIRKKVKVAPDDDRDAILKLFGGRE